MYPCPACGTKSISFLRKWLSSSSNPAECISCGAGSAIQIVDAAGFLAGSVVLVTLAGFAAVWLHSTLPLAIGVIGGVAWYLWRNHQAKLVVVSKSEQRTAQRSGWACLLASVLSVWFS